MTDTTDSKKMVKYNFGDCNDLRLSTSGIYYMAVNLYDLARDIDDELEAGDIPIDDDMFKQVYKRYKTCLGELEKFKTAFENLTGKDLDNEEKK